MSLKSTIVAGLAAFMLSSPMVDARITEVVKTYIGPQLELGTKSCMKRAELGDVVAGVLC